jgi:hypothetical protein
MNRCPKRILRVHIQPTPGIDDAGIGDQIEADGVTPEMMAERANVSG